MNWRGVHLVIALVKAILINVFFSALKVAAKIRNYIVSAWFLCPDLDHIWSGGRLKEGNLLSTQNSNFLIFQGEFFCDLGGNETSASSGSMAIRMGISGFLPLRETEI